MLSPSHDDDDDTHLCIKCNTTIIGLDEYIKHRKERCGKKYEAIEAIKASKVITTLDTWRLGADVFFQSLELQSSAKKPSLLTPPIPVCTKTLAIDRTKTLVVPSTSRDIPRMSPLDSNMRGEDWIGGHSLRIGNSEADNQTKLINAVASISGAVKKDMPSSSYNIVPYDFKPDEDSEEASEDSEDDEDEEPSPSGGKWKPPLHYTGGKWRPDSPDQEDWDTKVEEHTGGKWRLLPVDAVDNDEDYDAPPPGHTKGKWVPGAQDPKTQIMQTTIQTKSSVQYWCGACNRRLGSKAIYEKHLMSNLHMRKVLPENDLEFSGHMEPPKSVGEKRTSRPSQYTDDSIYQIAKKKKTSVDDLGKKKRKRKPFYTQCSGCKSRVRVHLMGKHLISHYHFRKATDVSSIAYQQLILDNMDAIVHQSPFQCSPCKFYANWLSNFMHHWFSQEHVGKMALIDGNYWCSFCKFECEDSDRMLEHMSSSDHSEVVAVINRSMPIITRKKTVFQCRDCLKTFRFNIEMKKHSQRTGHALSHTASDMYQELHNCVHCKDKFRSSLTLAAHLKAKHKQKAYLCLVCSKKFLTSDDAKKHRQTSEHRIRRKELMNERGVSTKDLTKKCPHCLDVPVVLKNILELKEHIRSVHPEIRKKCPKCGMSFILSQEVTRHIRDHACQYQSADHPVADTFWNCSQCPFTTDSQAECFFHEVLHTAPCTEVHKVSDKETLVQKFACPLCPKVFRKASLRHHIRQHTFERPYVCAACGANFTRQSSLANHARIEHRMEVGRSAGVAKIDKMMRKEIPDTNDEFSSKASKQGGSATTQQNQNTVVREHRCPHEDCSYAAATFAQLVRHRKCHGERVKQHECQYCDFRTDQASHMKRHKRCHEGEKPYACPHCTFVCGSLENLRKHVLRSGRHRGLPLYSCHHCSIHANTAAALRAHLTAAHSHLYDVKTAVEAVKRHLMKTD